MHPYPQDEPANRGNHVLVAVNPKAGARSGHDLVAALTTCLEARGFKVTPETDIDRLAAHAAELKANGQLRTVVAAGGDGTVSLVVNKTAIGTPIAVLPLGTENLLAKYVGLTNDVEQLADTIAAAKTWVFDAGLANGRLFLLMVSCGFDADVVRRLHEQREGHIHHLSYARPIFDSIVNYEYPELRLCCGRPDSGGEEFTARWAFVANLPRYAVGLGIVPDASGTDGLLDVCTFQEGSLWHGLKYLTTVLLGQHRTLSDCRTVRTSRVRITSDRPVPYQLDGDPGGNLPLEIEVVPRRFTLLVPLAWIKERAQTTATNLYQLAIEPTPSAQ